jgi:hypothetical protein
MTFEGEKPKIGKWSFWACVLFVALFIGIMRVLNPGNDWASFSTWFWYAIGGLALFWVFLKILIAILRDRSGG